MGLFGVLFLLLSILVLCMVSRGGWGGGDLKGFE